VRRDPAAEARCLNRFLEVGAEADDAEFGRFWLDREILMMSLPGLMDDGFRVEVNHRPVRRSGASTLGFEERDGRLRLTGGILFDDQEIGIGAVIAGRHVGDPFIRLEDGSLGFITDKWSETLAPLAALGEERGGALTFNPTQGLLVEQVLEGTGEIRSPRALGNLRSQLQSLSKPQEVSPPTGFVGTLRSYQSTGLGWLRALAASGLGGCLADDMGLGKTVQVAAFLLAARREDPSQEPALVIVPRSLLFNWEQELARFVPDLRVIRYTGASRRALRGNLPDHHVILTTYGTVRRDIDWLADQTFSSVVLDEAQAIKNPISQVARAVRRLQTPVRVSVTGTPVENRLLDFWSQMEFLNPGLLGSHRRFQESMGGKDAAGLRARLARTLGPLVLRRTKEEVAPELPEKLEQILHAPLLEDQAELYHRMRLRLRADLERRAADDALPANRIHVLEGLLRLRQIACHPGLLGADHAGASSGKLDLLMERLAEVHDGGHKALVFSQFTTFLGIVRDRLEAGGHSFAWLDGKTRKREEVVRRFQEDANCPFFLLSLKAGGVGLNLTAADYVFLLDPWWNPAVEAQAIDRAHRIGREGRVLAFRLVTRGTIEERVLALQEEKRALVDDLLGAASGSGPAIDEADLALLLGD